MHVKPDIVPGGLANVQAGVTVKPDIVEGLKLILDRFSPPQSTTIKTTVKPDIVGP
jgi:hypothetical protein